MTPDPSPDVFPLVSGQGVGLWDSVHPSPLSAAALPLSGFIFCGFSSFPVLLTIICLNIFKLKCVSLKCIANDSVYVYACIYMCDCLYVCVHVCVYVHACVPPPEQGGFYQG